MDTEPGKQSTGAFVPQATKISRRDAVFSPAVLNRHRVSSVHQVQISPASVHLETFSARTALQHRVELVMGGAGKGRRETEG